MPLANELIRSNNLGIRYLNDRDFPSAVGALRTALAIAKSNCLNMGANTTQRGAYLSLEPPRQKRLRAHSNALWESSTSSSARDENWTGVYSDGILLEPTSLSNDPFENEKCWAAIVIFNLACVFHVKALHESVCQIHLRKAKNLYAHSITLISGIDAISCRGNLKTGVPSTESICNNESFDFLYMAALNNMAFVDQELELEGDSALLFRKLFHFSQSLKTQRLQCGTYSDMDKQIEIFSQNALFSQTMTSKRTAAAAA
jgi:hypothetical protein